MNFLRFLIINLMIFSFHQYYLILFYRSFPTVSHDFAENMPVWTEVLALNAVDPDSPGTPVKYTVIAGDGINSFTVDSEGFSFSVEFLRNSSLDCFLYKFFY